MKKSELEEFLGKTVAIRLFNGTEANGELHKTGEERFKGLPNLYLTPNRYFLTVKGDTYCKSCLFRSSHVTKLEEIS